jgi:hypothetical protein
MSITFLSPSRTVLLISDEALFIYSVTARSARFVDTVAWLASDFDQTVTELLRKECGGKPVLILNDMTDQYFKGGQRLPNVGMLDKQNVLKRKLQVAFPSYPIRGALPIKQKKSPRRGGAADANAAAANIRTSGDLYLFAGVPMAEPISKTFEAVKKSMAPVAGFVLLPIESSDMVRALSEKLAGKERKVNEWAVFIGQHQSGALRQVVTRNGQLAMTRITMATDSDADSRTWAQDVYQEFKATLSYLSRYGFSEDDGADLMVVASPESGQALEELVDIPCNFTSFTVNEAARVLGMSLGPQQDSKFADALHAAWSGRKVSYILKMDAADLNRIHQPRQMASAAIFLLLAGTGYLGWMAASQAQAMISTNSEIADQQVVEAQVATEYQAEVDRMKDLGFDVKLIQASLKTFQSFEDRRMDVIPLLRKVSEGLGNELRLDKMVISNKMVPGKTDEFAEAPKPMEASLYMSFPQTIEMEEGKRQVTDLQRRLQGLLSGYTVDITKNIGAKDYQEVSSGEVGASRTLSAEQMDMQAEIKITGPLK